MVEFFGVIYTYFFGSLYYLVSTGWMGENFHSRFPVVFYGFVLLMSSLAFMLIEKTAIKQEGKESIIGKSVSQNLKEKGSSIGYI
ncbi:hypothetical protein [Empedobacter sp. 225-1]|uniref:hypothetical protein n=1 Tax=Empedobacter sp. 225-1 TaxID=2746725 RepID=UPI00336A81E0